MSFFDLWIDADHGNKPPFAPSVSRKVSLFHSNNTQYKGCVSYIAACSSRRPNDGAYSRTDMQGWPGLRVLPAAAHLRINGSDKLS